jgi:pyruvate dehydrogenase E1 component beta subunit
MGISADVIDPRSLKPLDEKMIIASVKKTGRLIVADTSWSACGFSSEVAAIAAEKAHKYLKAPVRRICVPPCPSPVSKTLEDIYYPTYKDIFIAACSLTGKRPDTRLIKEPVVDSFKGPY